MLLYIDIMVTDRSRGREGVLIVSILDYLDIC